MKIRVLTTTAALALTLVLLAGCSDQDTNEFNRIVCSAELVNDGTPIVSAYIDYGSDGAPGGTDDTYPIDFANIVFRARPFSLSTMTIPEDDAYSSFQITRYDLIWHPGPNVPVGPLPPPLTDFNIEGAGFELLVPIGEDAVSTFLVVGRPLKEALVSGLVGDGTADFTATAELRFWGHDSGSRHEVAVPASVFVYFTGAIYGN